MFQVRPFQSPRSGKPARQGRADCRDVPGTRPTPKGFQFQDLGLVHVRMNDTMIMSEVQELFGFWRNLVSLPAWNYGSGI